MTSFSLHNPDVLEALAAAGVLLVGGVAAWALLRRKPTDEEIERERRLTLVKMGRIVDGTVVDISDLSPSESDRPEGMKLMLYRYEIAGVVYNCSQDVTLMGDFVDIYQCRLSFPATIRYDAHNPENSIIVAENWSGLRETAAIAFGPPGAREANRAGVLSDRIAE